MIILAIDLGKAKSLFCWYDTADQTHSFKPVPTTPQAFHDALLERKVDRVVVEICDAAGWVKDLCQTIGIADVQVANSNGEGWRWKNVKNKTDKTDALKLARLSAAGDLKLVHLPARTTRQWRSLILYRHKLIERQTAVKNSIHALLVREGMAMSGGGAVWAPEALAKLWELAKPIEQCPMEQLWRGHLWMELKALDHLMEQIETVEGKLDELGQADHRVIRLQTIPGVGPRLAELVVAMIDDPKRFKNARQVSAYAGLTPRRYQSGVMDRTGRISKQGCGKLRKLLVQIAWGMLRHNPHGQAVFARISKGQKTRRKQAIVALARRVLVWCWAMLRDGSDWREPGPGRQPQTSRREPGPRRKPQTSRRQPAATTPIAVSG